MCKSHANSINSHFIDKHFEIFTKVGDNLDDGVRDEVARFDLSIEMRNKREQLETRTDKKATKQSYTNKTFVRNPIHYIIL